MLSTADKYKTDCRGPDECIKVANIKVNTSFKTFHLWLKQRANLTQISLDLAKVGSFGSDESSPKLGELLALSLNHA